MAKRSIKEIKNFNVGTVSNADPRETPDDGAVLSYDVDANAPGGVLRGRKIDAVKGNNFNLAQLKIDSGLIVNDGGDNVDSSQTTIGFLGTTLLSEGDYIVIDQEVILVNTVDGYIDGILNVTREQFSTTAAAHDDGSIIYRFINPIKAVSYLSEDGDDKENVVLFSDNGYVDGIYDWSYEQSGTVGAGINNPDVDANLEPDFDGFPKKFKHDNDISTVLRNGDFYIGAGAGNKAKWLGRIAKANLSGKTGFQLEDARLKTPLEGTDSTDYDKIITFQHSFSSGASLAAIDELDNGSKVLHIAYRKGSPYLYAIDGDTGQSHISSELPFKINAIAKCVSTKTEIKVWAYAKNDDDDTTIENPGKIYLLEIFDSESYDADEIKMGDGGYFDMGAGWAPTVHKIVNIIIAPVGSRPRGETDNYGYPSEPKYTKGSAHGGGYGGGQEISDILETVDSSGNGKLWILASPLDEDDENPLDNWFRITAYHRANSNHCCHRFLWASYERYNEAGSPQDHIDGDSWNDGEEKDIWFNDKSFSTQQVVNAGRYSGNNSVYQGQNVFGFATTQHPDDEEDWTGRTFRYRGLKRACPTVGDLESAGDSTTYVEPANIGTGGLDGLQTLYPTGSDNGALGNGDERYYHIVSGGSFWYWDASAGGNYTIGGYNTEGWQREIMSKNGDRHQHTFPANGGYNATPGSASGIHFKPLPNSLVDLSDLYPKPGGGFVDHVVGCYVNFDKGFMLEDLWAYVKGGSESKNHRMNGGFRIRRAEGSTCLWISSGALGNYGAYYQRHNSFGYKGEDNTSLNALDDVPMSTLCCDVDENVIRVMKWLPTQLPNKLTANLRNKSMTEFNGLTSDNDASPVYSALFSSFDPVDTEVNDGIFEFGNVLKLNTTQELADKYEPLITDTPANGLSGYNNADGTTSNIMTVTDGEPEDENSPSNKSPVFQTRGAQTLNSGTLEHSLNVENLSTAGGLTSSIKDLEDIIPNGPYNIVGFAHRTTSSSHANRGWLNRLHCNGRNGTAGGTDGIVHNYDGNATSYNPIIFADDNPLFIGGNTSQQVYWPNSNLSPPETDVNTGTLNMTDVNHTKCYSLEASNNSLALSSFGLLTGTTETSPEETSKLMIGHVWGKGNPDTYSGSGGGTGSSYSQYHTSDYRLSVFNRSGTTSAFHCSITDDPTFSDRDVQEFENATSSGTTPNKLFLSAIVNGKYQKATNLASITFTGKETALPEGDTLYTNYFPSETFKWYKISYEYDGFQDSPLSGSDFVYYDNATDYSSLEVNISISSDIPSRVTRVNVWRRNDANAFYKLIKSLKVNVGSWASHSIGGKSFFSKSFLDKGVVSEGQSYETYSNMSSFIMYTGMNYRISTSSSDYLFVADVSHPNIKEKGKSTIARSQKGNFSQFDAVSGSNVMTLRDKITALATFQGRVFAFTNNSTIRINPEEFIEEDVLVGFGCSHKDAVVVTEYGMFYADNNHIYLHDGNSAKIISFSIDSDDYSEKNISWSDMAASGTFKAIFMPKTNQVGFAVDYLDSTETYTGTYIWCYHILKQRWDLKKVWRGYIESKTVNLTFFNTLLDGSLYTFTEPLGVANYNYCMALAVDYDVPTIPGTFQWFSKKFSMENDTTVKRFIKIKIEADATIAEPSVFIDDNLVTLTSTGAVSGAGTYEYKIAGASKKGKNIQIKWGDGTVDGGGDFKNSAATIFSIGIIYRPGKVK